VFFSDTARAGVRVGLYTRALSLRRLSESGFDTNNRGVCDRHLAGAHNLAVLAVTVQSSYNGCRDLFSRSSTADETTRRVANGNEFDGAALSKTNVGLVGFHVNTGARVLGRDLSRRQRAGGSQVHCRLLARFYGNCSVGWGAPLLLRLSVGETVSPNKDNLIRSIAVLVVLVAAAGTFAQESQPQAQKFEEFIGEADYEHVMAILDNFSIEFKNRPNAKAHIIVYRTRHDSPAVSYQHLFRARDYMLRRGVDPKKIVLVDGGMTGCLMYELWFVPRGAQPPERRFTYKYSLAESTDWKPPSTSKKKKRRTQ
jgi:hypothetical protein